MLEKDLANLVSPVVEAVVAVEKNLSNLQAKVDAIKVVDGKDGADGKSVEPVEVAKSLKADPEFVEAIRGEKGLSGDVGPQGEQGLPGADGKDGKSVELSELAKAIKADPNFIEKLRGESGIGIKSVELGDDDKSMTLVMDNDVSVFVSLPSGPRGETGLAGLGLETKAWAPGVFREGAFVTHGIGKIYKALRDTADKPGGSDWERVGSAGFEWTGLKADRAYENGDLFIDGGSTFIWWDGKGHMFTQRGARGQQGEKGLDGRNGTDAPTIVAVKYTTKGAYIAMSDGSVLESEIDGLHDVVKEITQGAVLTWIDAVYQQIEDEGGTPIRSFRGEYRLSDSYSRGDVVNFNKAVWVAKDSTSANYFDDQVWRRMFSTGVGGGVGSGPTPPPGGPGSIGKTYSWQWVAKAGVGATGTGSANWVDTAIDFKTVVDHAAMLAIGSADVAPGKVVYVAGDDKFFQYIGGPVATGTAADWRSIGTPFMNFNRLSDLPANNAGTSIKSGDVALVRHMSDGVEYSNRLFRAQITHQGHIAWQEVGQRTFLRDLRGDAAPAPGFQGDTRYTLENGHAEILTYDGGTNTWVPIYSEDSVKAWIAAGNLFSGTVENTGFGVAGAIDLTALPAQSALGPNVKGHYYTFVGSPGYVIKPNDVGGAVSNIDGQKLNVGDWIQVAETAPGVYKYVVIPGDLLSKSRGDSLYSLKTWQAGAYEAGALIVDDGAIWRATSPIIAGDPAPSAVTNTKWTRIALNSDMRTVAGDAQLPASASSGVLYLVLNSAQNGNKPAIMTYDAAANNWALIGGGGGSGQALDLSGGAIVYPKNYSTDDAPASGLVVNDLRIPKGGAGAVAKLERWNGTAWETALYGHNGQAYTVRTEAEAVAQAGAWLLGVAVPRNNKALGVTTIDGRFKHHGSAFVALAVWYNGEQNIYHHAANEITASILTQHYGVGGAGAKDDTKNPVGEKGGRHLYLTQWWIPTYFQPADSTSSLTMKILKEPDRITLTGTFRSFLDVHFAPSATEFSYEIPTHSFVSGIGIYSVNSARVEDTLSKISGRMFVKNEVYEV